MITNRPAGILKGFSGWCSRNVIIALLCVALNVQPAQAVDTNTGEPANTAKITGADEASFNFVGADIESVIKAIGDYTQTTFIIDPRVKGTVNLVSEKPLTKDQSFRLLASVLRMQGYAVVPDNGYTKVVPEVDAKLQAGQAQDGAARGDQVVTQIFRLNHESANNLVVVLRPLISPNNTINANPGNNTLVITDYADNMKRLDKIISALDGPADSELEVIPVHHAIASDIVTMANKLLGPGNPGTPGGDTGRIKLLADSRNNAIIVRAPSEAHVSLAKALVAKLDQPTTQPGNVHVVYLKNAEAVKLAQTLRAVVSSDTSQQETTSPASEKTPLSSGGSAGFIQADPATNTLIITANESIYRNLRAIIDQLDARRAQVYIESLIVEVTATKAAEFGVQWTGLSGNANSSYRVGALTGFGGGGDNLINQGVASATKGDVLPPGNGLTVGVFRQTAGRIGLGALVRALASDDDANILSMPNLLTLDNEEAKIIVGQNVPFITGQYTTTASGGTAGVNPFQTIERKDIGLSLRVKPQISEGGTVKMTIYQETSSVFDATGAAGIITNKRSIDTNVLVDDGQIIVLGGLIDDNMRDGVAKVPVLGDIPLIGNLFKYQKRSRVKTNLMVFLRPTVIRNNEQSVNLSGDRYDYIRNAEIAGQPDKAGVLPDMGAPLLPPLQDGRMVGGPLSNQAESDVPENTPPTFPQNAVPQEPAAVAPQ